MHPELGACRSLAVICGSVPTNETAEVLVGRLSDAHTAKNLEPSQKNARQIVRKRRMFTCGMIEYDAIRSVGVRTLTITMHARCAPAAGHREIIV